MKFVAIMVLGGALGVAGCASAPRHQESWVKAGSTRQSFDQDRYECLKGAQIPPVYNAAYGRTETMDNNLFTACMGARGWSWQ